MGRCLKENERLTGLTPRIVATAWVAYESFRSQEVHRAVGRKEFRAESDFGGEGIGIGFGVCERQRILTVVSLFARDGKFQLEAVARVAARAGLDAAVHLGSRVTIGALEVVLETEANLALLLKIFFGW